jgi:SAM-dependent methyltransferase
VSFEVEAIAYDRFMGRFSQPLAAGFLGWAGAGDGPPALDVGCGPGALTARLAEALGAGQVSAVDPSASFVAAVQERLPGVDVRVSAAEALPFDDGAFGAAYAQLVVHFMTDPVAGLAQMRRVVRPGGTVAACLWDGAGSPIGPFWEVAREVDPSQPGPSRRPAAGADQLVELFGQAGLADIVDDAVEFTVPMATFEEWWEPFTLGVGPMGDYVARLSPEARERLREGCRARMPQAPFAVTARVRAVRGRA